MEKKKKKMRGTVAPVEEEEEDERKSGDATFEIRNQCPYTVWAAAVPGGGQQLNSGQDWRININPGTKGARIWGRTNCRFDGSGRGRCQTGDCGGLLRCQGGCRGIRCAADINRQCPNELRAPGGCDNPCTVFRRNEYCCTNGQGSCGPTNFSRFFKDRCRDAYSYPQDDSTSTFTCNGGGNYRVVFCP
ncbi:hypothetical protein AQUCO_04900034v1 [Aquilegia coerulea]|uniref:Thaumatin-like protein n=1 Tax=Aquilegia coerulea TaxID=218851 RepID=A0A2G5CJJ2_AQUCA|nr:hypothetical protein AQUCO_04900034v1 [Aquilegia coerulea]